MKIKKNDEWDYFDALGHNPLVRQIGHRLLSCEPPYVVGIAGSWGAGKTSFLRKLWAYLGGDVEWEDGKFKTIDAANKRTQWFNEKTTDYKDFAGGKNLELVWFNPWQHQFEASPLVALLNEIRQHFSIKRKLFSEAGKLTDVAIHATLNSVTDVAKDLKLPLPTARNILERGREYEAETFSSALGSQRFRQFFEYAIDKAINKKNGLMVIFIDDLDRCEGDVAYRLLEALKLYLNAKNCLYVLGIDQQHLEISIAKALSGEKETWRFRPLARDYLGKMFQTIFPLPMPRNARNYIDLLLDRDDRAFHHNLRTLFGLTIEDFQNDDWPRLVQALDRNLPHNPRKLKSFVASWKTYIDVLLRSDGEPLLEWRLTLILQYLAQFEEPLYRRIEQFPNFYADHLLAFCEKKPEAPHSLFRGIELPSEEQASTLLNQQSTESGELGSTGSGGKVDASKLDPEPRFFWISGLINDLGRDLKSISPEDIRRHLPQASGS
jgi:hypothetical protein